MIQKIAFIGNQGGRSVLAFYAAMAQNLVADFESEVRFSVWLDSEKGIPSELGMPNAMVSSFESFVRIQPAVDDLTVAHFIREYREMNWSEVVAVERAFTDYSMLIDSVGERRETVAYVQRLVVNMVRYLEGVMIGCDAMVCQTADTLFSLVAIKLAKHLGIRSFAIRPGTLLEPGKGGGFFANTEYLECDRMLTSYAERQGKGLLPEERVRTDALVQAIRGFGGLTAFQAATSKGKSRGRRALSPNLNRLLSYLRQNAQRDKYVDYTKIDPKRKILGNLLRVCRKWMSRNAYGSVSLDVIPERSVFFALHYQPEQSTLAQGLWHANQTALVENISKSLPLGYTLIVKEHPWGRGNRPLWQYRHLNGFYNVMFCDAPSKQIIQRVDAVITVTGTVAMEALVFDKPAVMLGRNYFEFSDLIYLVPNIQELPEVLARILIDGDYQAQPNREERLHRFLMAYLDGLVDSFPLPAHAADWSRALARELGLNPVPFENKMK
jgi:hypothetical protein